MLDDKGGLHNSEIETGGHWDGTWTAFGTSYSGSIPYKEKSGDNYYWEYNLSGSDTIKLFYNSWSGTVGIITPIGSANTTPKNVAKNIDPLDSQSGAQLAGTYTYNANGVNGTFVYVPQ